MRLVGKKVLRAFKNDALAFADYITFIDSDNEYGKSSFVERISYWHYKEHVVFNFWITSTKSGRVIFELDTPKKKYSQNQNKIGKILLYELKEYVENKNKMLDLLNESDIHYEVIEKEEEKRIGFSLFLQRKIKVILGRG